MATTFWKTPEALLRDIDPGDIIEFDRGWFSHYALFMGANDFGIPQVCNVCAEGKEHTSALIELRNYMKVCGSSRVRVRNHDNIAKEQYNKYPRSASEILAVANKYINRNWTYKFLIQNCEFYCTLWRFGVGFSTQVVEVKAQLLAPNVKAPPIDRWIRKQQTEGFEYHWYKQYSKNLPGSRVNDGSEESCMLM